jgi:SAM-dependent methyltransferase
MSAPPRTRRPDRHVLYEASVQNVEYDLDLFDRVYHSVRGARFTRLREDFCGTAALAAAWVIRSEEHHAWGVDAHAATLAWARRHRLPRLGAAARRLVLECRDVRERAGAKVDVVAAGNFSYWVFHARGELLEYFRAARRSLREGGLWIGHAFGGTHAMGQLTETLRVPATTSLAGDPVAPFTYVWEQTSFNPVDHRLRCSIHFRLKGGLTLRHAFRYDWRMWTLPELRELLVEAGFERAEVWVEGWDDERHRPDHVYRRRSRFENQKGWLAYVVGVA